jgi:hypothetical protein
MFYVLRRRMQQIPFTDLSEFIKARAEREEMALFEKCRLCCENGIRHYWRAWR